MNLLAKNTVSWLVCLVSAALAIVLWQGGWLYPWEAKTWDWRTKIMAGPGKATGNILLIKLDQKSLDWASQEYGWNWPWPREIYTAIISLCRRNGAKAVAFDVLFTEPSLYGVDDDRALAQSLGAYGKAAAAVTFNRSAAKLSPAAFKTPFHVSGLKDWLEKPETDLPVFNNIDRPVPEVADHCAILGSVMHHPDPDGISRRVSLFTLVRDTAFPCLGLSVFIAAKPKTRFSIADHRFLADGHVIPVDTSGRALLNFRGPAGTHQSVSAAWALQQEFRFRENGRRDSETEKLFRGKYVLFGFSAPGLFDLRSAPTDPVYPGLEIHATLLDNFLSNDFMQPLHSLVVIVLLITLCFFCTLLILRFSGVLILVPSVSAILLPPGLSLLFYKFGYWMPLVVMEVAGVLTLLFSLSVKYATEGRKKRYIKNAFRHYLSPHVINEIISHPEQLQLGGTRRTLSIFFSDLQGFTSISEGLTPEQLTDFLNDYLSEMTDIILEEDGTVDKYEGDAIIAFWNAPLEVPDHALRCVRAALRCQQKLAEMRPAFTERLGKEVFMRIGINTGPAVVGNLGSRSRFDYTMLGDSVNLAARLEGVNKAFATCTMVSEFTRRGLGDHFHFRELGRVAVVGRNEPVTIFEPMSQERARELSPVLKKFSESLSFFYRGDFIRAEELFNRTAREDPPAAKYAQRCRILIASPPKAWQGVWEMTEK